MAESDTEKTLEPTPERVQKAREEGQFARSRDGGATAASVAVLGCLIALGTNLSEILREFSLICFTSPAHVFDASFSAIASQMLLALVKLILPIAVAGALAGTAVGFLEAGFHPSFELVAPKWERLDPISKLKNMFSFKEAATGTLLSLFRVGAVGMVAYWVIRADLPTLIKLSRTSLGAGAHGAIQVSIRLAFWSSFVLVIMAAADYAQSWWRQRQELLMSREEMREEMKQQEGSPEIKARRRQLARDLLNRGLSRGVREADVIIVNPTHVSVALRYRADRGAPIVTAKGYDEVALHIRQLAKQYEVPLVENIPLARALAAQVKVGKMVPVDLYGAVAEVLAFVYRMKNRGLKA
ncbi:MAG: EscU/YscU/HrcU family type III secretion system export apparatus switch protein [Polyangiaceae bacterium]|nr:EscU/YscU/HrcU family type III secretion system export apparatus switch protein [Polyangiaceae bacterium]